MYVYVYFTLILFIRGVKCSKLISLPRFVLLRIVSLLLSAAVIDRESNKVSQFTSCRKNVRTCTCESLIIIVHV